MIKTLGEIAEKVGGELLGKPETEIHGVSGIREARKGEITFLTNSRYEPLLDETKASAVLIPKDVPPPENISAIRCENPSLAFSLIVEIFISLKAKLPCGIHPSAAIHPQAVLEDDVSVGPMAVIEEGVRIARGTRICAGAYIGASVRIGKECLIHPNVTILWGTVLEERVIIHSGTVIGSDGFGYMSLGEGHHKIPQFGIVVVEDDVEIGANVTVDRARFDKTVIGRGTKIDNLVQIAHNVVVGENSIIVAQVGISGSTRLGKNVTLAGQVGVIGHIDIGDRAVVGAQSGVSKSVLPGETLWGTPAAPLRKWMKQHALVRRLPDLVEKVKSLEEKMKSIKDGRKQSKND